MDFSLQETVTTPPLFAYRGDLKKKKKVEKHPCGEKHKVSGQVRCLLLLLESFGLGHSLFALLVSSFVLFPKEITGFHLHTFYLRKA